MRNVRNFWISGETTDRRTKFATGPASAAGGIDATIAMRLDGEVKQPVEIRGRSINGDLILDIDINAADFTVSTEPLDGGKMSIRIRSKR
jgi:hypothetical protein